MVVIDNAGVVSISQAAWGEFTGVFLGILAGTAVTILVQKWERFLQKGQAISNLQFEIDLNIKKLEGWLQELVKYRNALNTESLNDYFGYFKLSSAVGVIAFQLHQSGLIYEYLSHEQIGQLQEVFNDLSHNGETFLNNQIFQRKQELGIARDLGHFTLWQQDVKPKIGREIDYWEEKFKTHITTLRAISAAL